MSADGPTAAGWRHFVALGDSVTEGVGDPVEGLEMASWADRLAGALAATVPDLRYTNLARRGLKTREIRAAQLAPALALDPDLVSLIAGANDVLRPGWSLARYRDDLDAMLVALAPGGATIILGTLPDFTAVMPLPPTLAARLRGRLAEANAAVLELGRRYGAVCIDFESVPGAYDRRYWSADGLHPNAHGHLLYAATVARRLAERAGAPIAGPTLGGLPGGANA
ncbi:MAG: SGNH/GDSL hydrolase family protein [Chloroflexota bacterium]|nr:SGNH/GDSL hydrolase family protein [Chloroflexota bacterium]